MKADSVRRGVPSAEFHRGFRFPSMARRMEQRKREYPVFILFTVSGLNREDSRCWLKCVCHVWSWCVRVEPGAECF